MIDRRNSNRITNKSKSTHHAAESREDSTLDISKAQNLYFNEILDADINPSITANDRSDTESSKYAPSRFGSLLALLPFNLSKSNPVVAVLRLSGTIGRVSNFKSGLTIESTYELIERAFKVPKLEALCLIINSPGGSPVQSELIAKRLIQLSKEKDIPIYSFVEDVAASGGYWLALAGQEIYALRSSIIGSIGVVSSGFGFKKAIDKLGIERRLITQGKNKSVLDPFEDIKPGDVKLIKQLQSEIHAHFIGYVKHRRGARLTQSDDILFNGEFWTGNIATDYGLIDGIDDLYSFVKRRFGPETKIEYIASKQSWFKKKLGMTSINSEVINEISDGVISNIEDRLLNYKFKIDY